MNTEATSPVALAEPDDGPKWVEMTRAGMHVSRRAGGTATSGQSVVPLSDEDILSMVRGFAIAKGDGFFAGGMAPVGLNHSEFDAAKLTLTGGEPILGDMANFSEVRAEQNDEGGLSLMGLHTFTPIAQANVRADSLRGYSVDAAPPGSVQRRDETVIEEWVPFGGTLTNQPFVRGMQQVAASDALVVHLDGRPLTAPAQLPLKIHTPMEKNPMTDALNGVLGLAEGDAADKQIEKIIALRDEAAKVPGLEEKVELLTADVAALADVRDGLKGEIETHEKAADKRIIDDAVSAGRIALSEGAIYLKAFKVMGQEYAESRHPADTIAVAPIVLTDAKVDEGASVKTDANSQWEAAYAVALADSDGDERKAYAIAREATLDQRNAAYTARKTE